MRSTRGKSGWIWRSGAGPINAGSTAGDPRTSCGSVVSSIEIQAREMVRRDADGSKLFRMVQEIGSVDERCASSRPGRRNAWLSRLDHVESKDDNIPKLCQLQGRFCMVKSVPLVERPSWFGGCEDRMGITVLP